MARLRGWTTPALSHTARIKINLERLVDNLLPWKGLSGCWWITNMIRRANGVSYAPVHAMSGPVALAAAAAWPRQVWLQLAWELQLKQQSISLCC
jgi:hypothetical protein